MRTVRIEVLRDSDDIPLVLRARFERTFFGLGLSFALLLFAGGGYLLFDAIREPLEASAAAILSAGFALALAGFIVIYLAWPRTHVSIAHRDALERFDQEWKNYVLTAYGESVQNQLEARRSTDSHDDLPGPM